MMIVNWYQIKEYMKYSTLLSIFKPKKFFFLQYGSKKAFVLKCTTSNFRYDFAWLYVTWRNWLGTLWEVSLLVCLWVSVCLRACASHPGETFVECLNGTATPHREDDRAHTARLHHCPGPGCSCGPHGGKRTVRAGGLYTAAAQHRKSRRGL